MPLLPPAHRGNRHRRGRAGERACRQGWTPSGGRNRAGPCGAGLPPASIAGSRVLT